MKDLKIKCSPEEAVEMTMKEIGEMIAKSIDTSKTYYGNFEYNNGKLEVVIRFTRKDKNEKI